MSHPIKVINHVQDRAAAFLGVTPEDRQRLLDGMLRRSTADVVGYWLQLVLSMGIATLGLAMNSSAVVIGAMLISPLMGPLIELGTGLATGSLLLSLRAGVRTAGSVAAVVVGAAGVTRLLPFHEITGELAARTSPTMLDLFVAVFCALAAVYTTVRQSKDAISAAAGTAIGISLVPPLCTAGYGLGLANYEVFRGALLLFTANFAAITAIATLSVLALGYGQVAIGDIESDVLSEPVGRRLPDRAARLTRRAIGRRLGVLRLLIPAALLGAIIVPLKRALEEVSWQVRARSDVEALLAEVPGSVVRQSLEVHGRSVRVRLLLVGSNADAQAVAADLRTKIAARSGGDPVVEVIAVPDSAALDAMASQLRAATARVAPAVQPPPPAATFVAVLDQAIARHWPAAAGPLVRLRASSDLGPPVKLELEASHLGSPLGAAGEQLLADAWGRDLGVAVVLRDRPLPTGALEAPAEDGERWLVEAVRVLGLVAGHDHLHVCITMPEPPVAPAPDRRRRATPVAAAVPAPSVALVRTLVASLVRDRPEVELATGTGWRLEVRPTPCATTPPPVTPAPAPAPGP